MTKFTDHCQTTWQRAGIYVRRWNQLKLSFSEKDNDKLLERMARENRVLRDLLTDSGSIGKLSTLVVSSNGEGYSTVRGYAQGLYDGLEQNLTSGCSCSSPHETNLRLEARSNPKRTRRAETEWEAVSFTMMFSIKSTSLDTRDDLWSWRKTTVEPVKVGNSSEHAQKTRSQQGASIESRISPPDTLIPLPAAATSILDTLVATGSSNPRSRSVSTSEIATCYNDDHLMTPKSKSVNDLTQSDRISNLCDAIRTVESDDSCLGVLGHDLNRQYRISMIKSLQSTKIITLKSMLEKNTSLADRDRLVLAIKLAATLLQLYKTPWLAEVWGRDDILFVQVQSKDSPGTYLREPFVTRSFLRKGGQQTPTNGPVAFKRKPRESITVRVPPLFSLGILLIELSYCKPFEALGPSEGLPGACKDVGCSGMCKDDIRFFVALRLLDNQNEKGLNRAWTGIRYADAVRRCIRGDLDISEGDYDGDAFHSAVYRGVVEPLIQTLKSLCGESDELVDTVLS